MQQSIRITSFPVIPQTEVSEQGIHPPARTSSHQGVAPTTPHTQDCADTYESSWSPRTHTYIDGQLVNTEYDTYSHIGIYPDIFSGIYSLENYDCGYFRFFPYRLIRKLLNDSDYTMTYFHPRDFDPNQPVLEGLSLKRKFKSYYNLSGAYSKFKQLVIAIGVAPTEIKFLKLSYFKNLLIHLRYSFENDLHRIQQLFLGPLQHK